MPKKTDPIGYAEIGKLLEVRRETVQMWGYRKILPEPDFTVNGMPAWETRTIIGWAVETGRLGIDGHRPVHEAHEHEVEAG